MLDVANWILIKIFFIYCNLLDSIQIRWIIKVKGEMTHLNKYSFKKLLKFVFYVTVTISSVLLILYLNVLSYKILG